MVHKKLTPEKKLTTMAAKTLLKTNSASVFPHHTQIFRNVMFEL